MPLTELPAVIEHYQLAHDRGDTDTAIAAFSADATVTDDGRTYAGTDQIRAWLSTAASEYTFARTLLSTELVPPDSWLVVNHLEGDFPGGVVDLQYRFVVQGGLITDLEIAP